jgi:hypothetical protein
MNFCRLHQKIILSRLDENSALPRRAQRHLKSCPSCRQAFESARATGRALSVDSPENNLEPSPFLHGKIMSAVGAERGQSGRPRPDFARWALPIVAATFCVIIAGTVWTRRTPAPAGNPSAARWAPTEPALKMRLPNEAQMNQWSAALDAPLEQETQLVLNDAKAALDSLKNSFLPDLDEVPWHGRN